MPCPQCLLCSTCLGKVLVSGGGWQADLFLEDRAKGVSQRPGCFLVLKSLLFFFFFYSFLFKQLEGIWCKAHFLACPSAVISFLSCVLISDSWIASHLDFLTPQISESVQNHLSSILGTSTHLSIYLFNPLSSPSLSLPPAFPILFFSSFCLEVLGMGPGACWASALPLGSTVALALFFPQSVVLDVWRYFSNISIETHCFLCCKTFYILKIKDR